MNPEDLTQTQREALLHAEILRQALPDLEPSAALQRRVFEVPLRNPLHSNRPGLWLLQTWWRTATLALGVLLLGAASGWVTTDSAYSNSNYSEANTGSSTSTDIASEEEEWEALSELALAVDWEEE